MNKNSKKSDKTSIEPLVASRQESTKVYRDNKIKFFNGKSLLETKFPVRENILKPILKVQDLVEIHAFRGCGKTYFALAMAAHIACGCNFLKWQCNKPYKVLYLDGEMLAQDIQDRVRNIINWGQFNVNLFDENFIYYGATLQDHIVPSLSSWEGQEYFMPAIDLAQVVIIDSYLTLASTSLDYNDIRSSQPFQEFLLLLRRQGKTCIFLHHSGKNGGQLGTSGRETVLDTVIKLEQLPAQGGNETKVRLSFEKSRSFFGQDAMPLDLTLDSRGWSWSPAQDGEKELLQKLWSLGFSQEEIAKELNVYQSTVSRKLKKYGLK